MQGSRRFPLLAAIGLALCCAASAVALPDTAPMVFAFGATACAVATVYFLLRDFKAETPEPLRLDFRLPLRLFGERVKTLLRALRNVHPLYLREAQGNGWRMSPSV